MIEEIIISTKEFERVFDKIDSLEQDSKQLTQWLDEARRNADFWCDKCTSLEQENSELKELNKKICEDCSKEIKVYWNVLGEIRELTKNGNVIDGIRLKIIDKINEVLNEN